MLDMAGLEARATPVAAGVFGLVEGHVGVVDESVGFCGAEDHPAGDSDAAGDAQRLSIEDQERTLGYRQTEAFGLLPGAGAWAAGQHDQEFLPAVAAHGVVRSDGASHAAGRFAQYG